MKTYFYVLRNKNGSLIKGQIQAQSQKDALEILSTADNFVLSIKKRSHFWQKQNIPTIDILLFCRQLSILLSSNVSLNDAINVLLQSSPKKLKNFYQMITLSLSQGNSLSDSIKNSDFKFPSIIISFIIIGEISGNLPNSLIKAEQYLKYNYLAKERLKTASIYPLILCFALFLSIGAIYYFILPSMNLLLNNLNVPLPLFTKILLQSNYPKLFFLSNFVLLILLFFIYLKHRLLFYKFLFKVPILGNLFQNIFLFRLASSFEALLGAGINLNESIYILKEHIDNIYLKDLLKKALISLNKGIPLSIAWQNKLPPLFLQLILAGENSGNLVNIFNILMNFYKDEIKILQKKTIALLEPFVLIILAIFIGSFVIATILPLLDAVSYVNL